MKFNAIQFKCWNNNLLYGRVVAVVLVVCCFATRVLVGNGDDDHLSRSAVMLYVCLRAGHTSLRGHSVRQEELTLFVRPNQQHSTDSSPCRRNLHESAETATTTTRSTRLRVARSTEVLAGVSTNSLSLSFNCIYHVFPIIVVTTTESYSKGKHNIHNDLLSTAEKWDSSDNYDCDCGCD